jgi:hypothetical protein
LDEIREETIQKLAIQINLLSFILYHSYKGFPFDEERDHHGKGGIKELRIFIIRITNSFHTQRNSKKDSEWLANE